MPRNPVAGNSSWSEVIARDALGIIMDAMADGTAGTIGARNP